MQTPDISKITIDRILLPWLKEKNIHLEMLRLDKIHPVISGNKWFKLKYHLENFYREKYNGIITFGGAWSNHVVATACTCYLQNIKSIAIIRGEKPTQLSATLQQAQDYNMELKFITRDMYRQKNDTAFIESLKKEFPRYYIIPEGGAGSAGEKGAGEILQLTDSTFYTHIACAVGTATMFHGISRAALPQQQILGIAVLKGWKEISENPNVIIFTDYHFGGYAKYSQELIDFMNKFYRHTLIPIDFVYTGKLLFAINDLACKNYFPPGSKILLIHSGGLQGNASLAKGSLIF